MWYFTTLDAEFHNPTLSAFIPCANNHCVVYRTVVPLWNVIPATPSNTAGGEVTQVVTTQTVVPVLSLLLSPLHKSSATFSVMHVSAVYTDNTGHETKRVISTGIVTHGQYLLISVKEIPHRKAVVSASLTLAKGSTVDISSPTAASIVVKHHS